MSAATQSADGQVVTFTEHVIQVEGKRIRYLEAGQGNPVVVLHGKDGLTPSPFNSLLARQFRVIALEIPDLSRPPENAWSQSRRDLAQVLA